MGKVTITLKLKFVDLNQAKALMFGKMTEENTRASELAVNYSTSCQVGS